MDTVLLVIALIGTPNLTRVECGKVTDALVDISIVENKLNDKPIRNNMQQIKDWARSCRERATTGVN